MTDPALAATATGPSEGGLVDGVLGRRVRAYVRLTKPRVVELLLVTTVPAMVLAEGGWPRTGLVIAVVIGGVGTLVGGPLGAALLVVLKELLSSTFGHWYLFLGIIFAGVALLMPRVLVGSLLDLNDWRKSRAAATPKGRLLDLFDDLIGRELLERFGQGLITAVLDVDIDVAGAPLQMKSRCNNLGHGFLIRFSSSR